MKAAVQTCLFVGLLASPFALPVAAQGGHGGAGGGGAGGTYTGPGDTTPQPTPNDSPPPPPTPGPSDTGGGTRGGQPGPGQPPTPANPGGLPTGVAPPLPPDEPTTPDGQPPVADASSWQLWWHYNRWDSLPVGRARELLATTGASEFFLGRGQKPQTAGILRASEQEITTVVRPALLNVLRQGGRNELVTHALLALAKLRDYQVQGTWTFDAAARHYMRDNNQDVAEKALLALGVRGKASSFQLLSAVLADDRVGRDLVGRSRVGHRLRAYAVYGMALLADRNTDPGFRAKVYNRLAFALEDDRPEVRAAAAMAIGFTALPPAPTAGDVTAAPKTPTREQQVQTLIAFFQDKKKGMLPRSQAPNALARLLEDAPEALREEGARALLAATGRRSSEPTEVRNGAVIALGSIGNAGATALDADIRDQLERVITGPGADRVTRYLALISLAQVSRRMGEGEAPLAAMPQTRRFLLRHFARSRGQTMAWTALALGLLEENAAERGDMPSSDAADALRTELKKSRSADVVGAVALGLGMMRDVESQDLLLERAKEAGSAPVRGYAALALGMIGTTEDLEPLRELLRKSANRPGTLQHVAIGLSLLGDTQTGPMLADLLTHASSPAVQASIAAAMGWVKDPRPLPELSSRLIDRGTNDTSRAWTAVAVGRICDPEDLPWNARFSIGVNYDVALQTLVDADTRRGLLDLP